MHKKKNQKPTTNLVAQKQADTSPTKKPKPTQVLPTPQKEEGNISRNKITLWQIIFRLDKIKTQNENRYSYSH